jgi:hypothetical protein
MARRACSCRRLDDVIPRAANSPRFDAAGVMPEMASPCGRTGSSGGIVRRLFRIGFFGVLPMAHLRRGTRNARRFSYHGYRAVEKYSRSIHVTRFSLPITAAIGVATGSNPALGKRRGETCGNYDRPSVDLHGIECSSRCRAQQRQMLAQPNTSMEEE